MVVATQNPIEMEGTYPLPEAQRDRFMARISMGYPDKDSEMEMLETHQATSPLTRVTAVVTSADVAAMIATVQQVYVSQAVKEYTVSWGAPRGKAPCSGSAPARGPCSSCCARPRPRRPWRAGTSCCRTTSSALPNPCWPTGSSWTARPPAPARRPRASIRGSPGQASGQSGDAVRPRRPAARAADRRRAHRAARPRTRAARSGRRWRCWTGSRATSSAPAAGGCWPRASFPCSAAQVMGRRDLLTLGILLIVLPLVSLAGIRVLKPRFQVYREFNPSSVETASTTTVRLAVAGPARERPGDHGGTPSAAVRGIAGVPVPGHGPPSAGRAATNTSSAPASGASS